MDWLGNRPHGVVLTYNYQSRTEWAKYFSSCGLAETTWTTRVPIYPAPVSFFAGRGLHFVSLLTMIRCLPGVFERVFAMTARLGSPLQVQSRGSQARSLTDRPISVARRQRIAQEKVRPSGRPAIRMVRKWRIAWTSNRKITQVS